MDKPTLNDHAILSALRQRWSPLAFDPEPVPTEQITVEYDGGKYSGWAEQKNARTVMGELRAAFEQTLQCQVELVGAGRTDAGVHARGQVAHVKFNSKSNVSEVFVAAQVNQRLPAEICIAKMVKASPTFHARHDAVAREYVYQISTRKTAFEKRYVWWVKEKLDVAAMQAAAMGTSSATSVPVHCAEQSA